MRTTLMGLFFCSVFCCGLSLTVLPQLAVTPQIPATGLIRKDQLWNVLLVNNSETPVSIQVQVTLQDIKTGDAVLTGASRTMTINKGAKLLQITDANPVQYSYGMAAALTDRTATGLLPLGNYQVCYAVIDQSSKAIPNAVSECVPVSIESLSPPLLNTPADRDTVVVSGLLFQWIPPAPLTMFNDLNYDLTLVEVFKGQNSEEAVQKNTPIFQQPYIKNMFLPYPASSKSLEAGKTYAWQIIAKNGDSYAEKTDSWAFTVKNDSLKIILDYEAYPALTPGGNGSYYLCQGKIRFSYKNEINDSLLALKFYLRGSDTATPLITKSIKIKPGQNYIDSDVRENSALRENVFYLMEAVNSRNEKWTLFFKYTPLKK